MICEKCNAVIPDDSDFCLKCGNKIDNFKISESTLIESRSNNDNYFSKNVLITVIAVLILAYLLGYENQNKTTSNNEAVIEEENSINQSKEHNEIKSEALKKAYANANADKESAWIFAQDAIKANLKAPSTAKFPWYDESCVTVLDDGSYIVKSYVDAENSYGAKIRNVFSIRITITGENSYTYSELNLQ